MFKKWDTVVLKVWVLDDPSFRRGELPSLGSSRNVRLRHARRVTRDDDIAFAWDTPECDDKCVGRLDLYDLIARANEMLRSHAWLRGASHPPKEREDEPIMHDRHELCYQLHVDDDLLTRFRTTQLLEEPVRLSYLLIPGLYQPRREDRQEAVLPPWKRHLVQSVLQHNLCYFVDGVSVQVGVLALGFNGQVAINPEAVVVRFRGRHEYSSRNVSLSTSPHGYAMNGPLYYTKIVSKVCEDANNFYSYRSASIGESRAARLAG